MATIKITGITKNPTIQTNTGKSVAMALKFLLKEGFSLVSGLLIEIALL
jgi:hypothetical protein